MITTRNAVFILFLSTCFTASFVSCSKDIPTQEETPKPPIPSKTLTGINITNLPHQTEYVLGETLNLTGLVVNGTYSDHTTAPISIRTEDVTGFTSDKPSEKTILTIKIESHLATFAIKVLPLQVENGILMKVVGDVKELTLPNSIREIGNETFKQSKLTKLTINEGVTRIGEMAFAWSDITEINFPKSLKELGASTFYGCKHLSHIDLSNTALTVIPKECFTLSSITTILLPTKLNQIGTQAFLLTSKLSEVTLPNGTQQLGKEAFRESGISKVSLPNSICSLSDRTFYYCTTLERVETFGSYAVSSTEPALCMMGSSCFEGCSKLNHFDIPQGIKVIGQNVLSKSLSLTQLILGERIEQINFSAFGNSSLTHITVKRDLPPIAETVSGVWYGFPANIQSIQVNKGKAELYKKATGWNTFSEKIKEN